MNTQQVLKRANISTVTPDQIGKCYLVIDEQTGNRFYKVESEQDSSVEYTVRYSPKFGFTCTCKAGQNGFAHCKNGVCKHVVWALAAAAEERAALAEQARKANAHYLEIAGEEQTQEVVNALLARPALKPFKHEIAQADAMSRARAFSLYR